MATMQIVWIGLIVVFIVVEAATTSLWSIWFVLGSLVAFIVSLFAPLNLPLQFALFLVVSVVAILALRPFARRFMGSRRVPTNADANIGKIGQVVTEVHPERFGRMKLEGLEWTAKSDCLMPVGSWGRVVAIEGVKLVVVPAETEEGKGACAPAGQAEEQEFKGGKP